MKNEATSYKKLLPPVTQAERAALKRAFRERIWKAPGGCWIWTGPKCKGYGLFCFGGARDYAHRAALLIKNNWQPLEGHVLHSCSNTLCVRHIRVSTNAENRQDALRDGTMWALSVYQVAEIHRLRTKGLTQAAIGALLGCSTSTVSKILAGHFNLAYRLAA